MKQFVRYLYAYQNKRRTRNVGFVKCELGERKAVLQIYGKGFPVNGNDMYELFVFYLQDDKCIGISLGTLNHGSPVFSYRLEYDDNDVEGPEIFGKIEGIILAKGQGEGRSWYAAGWHDKNYEIEQMITRQEMLPEVMPEEVTEEIPLEEVMPEELPAEELIPEEVPVEEPVRGETVQDTDVRCNQPAKDMIHKIMREDLAKLPRCEWKLANNHFLLHGYHNYHHLISFEKEDACWIGVPGIFHPNEKKAATLFGFERFMIPDEGEIELPGDQREESDEFGYWCRRVSQVIEG